MPADWTIPTLHDHIEALLTERDRRYSDLLAATSAALSAAIGAQERAMQAALVASDKAVTKSEDAQREYNIRSNEFRGQLEDQQKTFLARTEYTAAHIALDDKLVGMQKNYDGQLIRITENLEGKLRGAQMSLEEKIIGLATSIEKTTDRNADDIKSLRESRSEGQGRRTSNGELVALLVGLALVLATLLIAFGPLLLRR